MDEFDRPSKNVKKEDSVKLTAEVLIVVILAIVLAGVINVAVFDTTRVSGSSMDDTLYGGGRADINQDTLFDRVFLGAPDDNGDKVLMLKTKKVERGDIVVFHPKNEPDKQYIKRVIGVAGDTVRIADGKVFLNGQQLDESAYVTGETYVEVSWDTGDEKSWTVPEGCVFVMGDNRRNSTDSRRAEVGFVETSSIVGRVILVIKKDAKKLVLAKNL